MGSEDNEEQTFEDSSFMDQANIDMPILLKKAHIENLHIEIDVIEKLKEYYNQAKNFLEECWNRLVGIYEDNTKKEVENKK